MLSIKYNWILFLLDGSGWLFHGILSVSTLILYKQTFNGTKNKEQKQKTLAEKVAQMNCLYIFFTAKFLNLLIVCLMMIQNCKAIYSRFILALSWFYFLSSHVNFTFRTANAVFYCPDFLLAQDSWVKPWQYNFTWMLKFF